MSTTAASRQTWIDLALVLILAAVLRVWNLDDQPLWMDEIIAVTHAMQRPIDVMLSCLRFDMHPPLYFMQLAAWSAISTDDFFLQLNSVLWSLGSIAALYLLAKPLFGRPTALAAALILAVLANSIAYAQSLRMYSFLTVFNVICGFLVYRLAVSGKPVAWRTMWPILGCQFVAIASHAIGFYFAFFMTLFGFWMLAAHQRSGRDIWAFALWHVPIGLLSIPIALSSIVRPSASPQVSDVSDLFTSLMALTASTSSVAVLGSVLLGAALAMTLASLASSLLPDERKRPFVLAIVGAPLIVALIVSALIKPMYKAWAFAYSAPWIALGLAIMAQWLAGKLAPARHHLLAAGLVAVLVAVNLAITAQVAIHKRKPQDYEQASAWLAAQLKPGDVIIATGNTAFWGLARYMVGHRWGRVLDIANPPSEVFVSIKQRLPAATHNLLGLAPSTDTLMVGDVPLINASTPAISPRLAAYQRVWLVQTRQTADKLAFPQGLQLGGQCWAEQKSGLQGILVELTTCN